MEPLPRLRYDSSALLAGAGVSIASGLASGQIFNRGLLPRVVPREIAERGTGRALIAPAPARRHPRRGNIRFEQLVEIVRGVTDPELLVLQYLEQSWEPSALHRWLARAAQRGAALMTTNLDSLIETAYRREHGGTLPQFASIDEFEAFGGGTPSLIKLHGTIRRADYVPGGDLFADRDRRAVETYGVTLDRIGRLAESPHGSGGEFLLPPPLLHLLARLLEGRDLVVAGYSGSDDFDVMPSLRQLRSVYRRVIWIEHRPGAVRVRADGSLVYVRGPTLQVLQEMFGPQELPADPPGVDAAAAFESFCEQWSREVALDEQKKYLITGSVLHAMGLLSNALSVWESGIDEVSSSDPIAATRFCLSLGNAYLAERSWTFACEVFEVAILRSHRVDDFIPNAFANIGYAFVLGITDESRRAWEHAGDLLSQYFGIAVQYETLVGVEVRAALTIATLARAKRREELVERCSAFRDRLSLLRHYEDWPILQESKVLRAEFLAELALAEAGEDEPESADRHARELRSLCFTLNLPLVYAAFVLELGDLFGENAQMEEALELYGQAEMLFRRSGYPVGRAEATLAAAVMAFGLGRPVDQSALAEARATFAEEGLHRKAELTGDLWPGGLYDDVHRWWREFLGKAGWLTSRRLDALQFPATGGHDG